MCIRDRAVAQKVSEEERKAKFPSLEEVMPEVYKELDEIQHHLEQYFKDMQDIEFTIQDGKLWMLQCRNGKRTGAAMVKIAMDMLREGLIDEKTAVLRCEPAKLDELPVSYTHLDVYKRQVLGWGQTCKRGRRPR